MPDVTYNIDHSSGIDAAITKQILTVKRRGRPCGNVSTAVAHSRNPCWLRHHSFPVDAWPALEFCSFLFDFCCSQSRFVSSSEAKTENDTPLTSKKGQHDKQTSEVECYLTLTTLLCIPGCVRATFQNQKDRAVHAVVLRTFRDCFPVYGPILSSVRFSLISGCGESHPTVEIARFRQNVSERLSFTREELPASIDNFTSKMVLVLLVRHENVRQRIREHKFFEVLSLGKRYCAPREYFPAPLPWDDSS